MADNTAGELEGAAIRARDNSTVNVRDTVFSHNRAREFAGCVSGGGALASALGGALSWRTKLVDVHGWVEGRVLV